ncbi:MAG: C13 family peptidase [Nanoarchaeota archaeon]|nr:C13 family peptidase [Nanoarchaeota archaeon]MBU4242008.1 C13 family peptidase [Nanoarchaeota archaeon]MBU4352575.1 C13 family peptidase [Nanoarchaeota archaeon]MCG2719972.1 C13 family peptidase [Nanoarchaeota archaeon]
MKRGLLAKLILPIALATTAYAKPIDKPVEQKVEQPYTLKAKRNNSVEKYGIIMVGSSRGGRDYSDPIDKNCFWLNGTYAYKYLEELGFNKLFMFYADGKPDFNEKVNEETIKKLKGRFKGKPELYSATIDNLESIVNKLSKKIDDNDIFVLVIETHGNEFMLEMQGDGHDLSPWNLNKILKDVKPGYGLLYIDACHSGSYIDHLDLPNFTILSSTEDHTLGWGDRGFSGARYFFRSLLDPESDTNVDGKVTIKEAFEKSKNDANNHLVRIWNFLLNRYNWEEAGDPKNLAKEISVVPQIIVGKKSSDQFYIFDSWYFVKEKKK